MILAIDIGNTNVVVGLYKSDDLVVDFRISTDRSKTEDEYGMLLLQLLKFHNIKPEEIRGSIISSVVPPVIPVFGFVGQVDEIVRRMKLEMESSPKVIATGGLAELISTESKQIQVVDKYLTLKGLRILYERNQGR